MNQTQIQSVVKVILTFVGGLLAAKGWLSNESVSALTADILAVIGPAITLATLAWSIYQHTTANKIASTAALPEVKTIVTTPAMAATVPAGNVVAAAPPSAGSL